MTSDELVARVMRAMLASVNSEFEDVGQPISQMRILDQYRNMGLEKMARAAIAALRADT